MPNHDEIMAILEGKIHLAHANAALSDALFRYIRHLAIYQAIRSAGIDQDPLQFDEPYPSDLFALVDSERKDCSTSTTAY